MSPFQSESNAFAPCQTVSLSVNGSSAQPPFYMVAYEREGTTTVSPVGSDPSQLTWQVDHRSGSTLALGLVDSAGNSGGVSPSTWSVQDDRSSSSSACLPSPSASAPTFSANVTGHLSTCQPLEILVQGGAPPYTVTIAQQGAGVINATLRPDEDMYTFINRATPGSTLLGKPARFPLRPREPHSPSFRLRPSINSPNSRRDRRVRYLPLPTYTAPTSNLHFSPARDTGHRERCP
ncbi:hypothetical protein OF83DRAFT_1062130 [Amylostereum chailletii]|nr:hypothetical protein OF83DRAFT_1062130 [Amylostereum chailletii]